MKSKHPDNFPVLDLIAKFRFKSPGSISFGLGTESDTLDFPDEGISFSVGRGGVFNVVGSVDVHYPCEGHIKVRMCALLPARYHHWEQMKEFIERVFAVLAIPADETYEAEFVSVDRHTCIEQPVDRHGMTDRI